MADVLSAPMSPDAIFEHGSRTYYNASKFFPKVLRNRVTTLYAFVRTADDYVDARPQDASGFAAFRQRWNSAADGAPSGDSVVDNFAALSSEAGFQREWVEAFLDAMQADLTVREYDTLDSTLGYVYGSAEVIAVCSWHASWNCLRNHTRLQSRLDGRCNMSTLYVTLQKTERWVGATFRLRVPILP